MRHTALEMEICSQRRNIDNSLLVEGKIHFLKCVMRTVQPQGERVSSRLATFDVVENHETDTSVYRESFSRMYLQGANRGHDISEVTITSESLIFANNSGKIDASPSPVRQSQHPYFRILDTAKSA